MLHNRREVQTELLQQKLEASAFNIETTFQMFVSLLQAFHAAAFFLS